MRRFFQGSILRDISLLLTRGRVLRSGAQQPLPLDIAIGADGRILAVEPKFLEGAQKIIDLDGKLVVSGLVDAHQHLDKSRTRGSVDNPEGTLEGASAAYRKFAATVTRENIMARAARTLNAC